MLETMKRILTMAGKYRHKVTIGIIISLLHSFLSLETIVLKQLLNIYLVPATMSFTKSVWRLVKN